MSDYTENEFDNFEETPPPAGPGGPNNRTFILVAGILGAIFLISLLALVLVVMNRQPRAAADRQEQAALINAQNTLTAQAATKIGYVQLQQQVQATATKEPAQSQNPVVSSPSPVLIFNTATLTSAATNTVDSKGVGGDPMSHTQTVAALLTLAAQGQTPVPTSAVSSTALPETGLMDDLGAPGMLAIAVGLVIVIFMVRRLRQ